MSVTGGLYKRSGQSKESKEEERLISGVDHDSAVYSILSSVFLTC